MDRADIDQMLEKLSEQEKLLKVLRMVSEDNCPTITLGFNDQLITVRDPSYAWPPHERSVLGDLVGQVAYRHLETAIASIREALETHLAITAAVLANQVKQSTGAVASVQSGPGQVEVKLSYPE